MKIKTNLEHALYYAEKLEFSIIPIVHGAKKPSIKTWKNYQTEKATSAQIKEWWSDNPNANIGIVCGPISGIIVIDIDDEEMFKKSSLNLPATRSVKTSKGFHAYYRISPNHNVTAISKKLPFGDFKRDGGYVVAPTSLHKDGTIYEWITGIPENIEDITEVSTDLLNSLKILQKSDEEQDTILPYKSVSKGNRNNTLTTAVGKLLHTAPIESWKSEVLPKLYELNRAICKPPLAQNEVLGIFNSISNAEQHRRAEMSTTEEKPKKADIGLFLNKLGIETFHDERNEPYVRIYMNDHYENWSCDSDRLKSWMSKCFYAECKKTLRTDELKNMIGVFKGKALFESEQHPLSSRLSYTNDILWYDLVNPMWEAVRINKNGWNIIEKPPILFKRFEHQKEQVVPVKGGNPHNILDFVNIQDEDQKILFLVFLVSAFIPDFPHPMPFFYGPQGSAKSTISKIARQLIDPSHIDVSQFPNRQDELVQMFDHHTILFFDNISYISSKQSDMLCKVITGGAFSKRKLYSDNDDIIYSFKKTVGMNGISLVLTKPDILERSLLFPLDRVSKSNRIQEKKLIKNFEDKLPMILGGIFDTISKAMLIKEETKLKEVPRMADFAIWGSVISKVLGYEDNKFMDAYLRNIESQDMEILYEDTTASAIMQFMEDKEEWTGTSSELLNQLSFIDGINDKSLPKSHSALSRKLNALAITLQKGGIKFEKIVTNVRNIKLTKTRINAADADNKYNDF